MDESLVTAMGNALAVISALLHSSGVATMQDMSDMLLLVGTVDAEARPEESVILCAWAEMIGDAAGMLDRPATPPS